MIDVSALSDRLRGIVPERITEIFARSGSARPTGVEFSSQAVRVVRVDTDAARPLVTHMAARLIPAGVAVGSELRDPDSAAEELQALLAEREIGTGDAAVAVPETYAGQDTIPRGNYEDAVQAARRVKTIQSAEWRVDASIIDPDGKGSKMKIVIGGVRESRVRERQMAAAVAGLRVVSMDADLFALYNAHSYLLGGNLGDVSHLVHVGHDGTLVVVLAQGQFRRGADVGIGTEPLMAVLRRGEPTATYDEILAEISSERFPMSYADVFDPWAKRLCEQVAPRVGRNKSGRVLLSGEGALVHGMAGRLTEAVGREIEVFDPTLHITVSDPSVPEGAGTAFTLPLGLALRLTA